MGKRKCGACDPSNPPLISPPLPPPDVTCSSQMDNISAEQKSSHPIDTSVVNPTSSATGITDRPVKQTKVHLSLGHHHPYNLSRSIFIKRSRHYSGHRYFLQNSAGHDYNVSTSQEKGDAPLLYRRPCFVVGGRCNSEFEHRRQRREKLFCQPKRIKPSFAVINAVSSEAAKLVCGICLKSLRWYVVAAVLVCGHVYHSECLEHWTHVDDIRDPCCPVCSGLILKAKAAA